MSASKVHQTFQSDFWLEGQWLKVNKVMVSSLSYIVSLDKKLCSTFTLSNQVHTNGGNHAMD